MVFAHLIAAPLMHSEDKQWWSRKPLTEPSVPVIEGWGRNEVDSFILHKLTEYKKFGILVESVVEVEKEMFN